MFSCDLGFFGGMFAWSGEVCAWGLVKRNVAFLFLTPTNTKHSLSRSRLSVKVSESHGIHVKSNVPVENSRDVESRCDLVRGPRGAR